MTSDGESVAALLTPLAPGAIAVIGMVGPNAYTILPQITWTMRDQEPVSLAPEIPRRCRIVDRGEVIDEALVVITHAPGGLPLVEIHTHGGVRIVQRVLELMSRHGVRIVPPDQFHASISRDGPIETRIDRLLMDAQSTRMAEWLLSQRRILPAFLKNLQSLSEAERSEFDRRSRAARDLIRGIRIAIIGPPNAGKSTLANRLIGHDRIITSDTPGTTRDWVSEIAVIQGWPVTLTDTAGVRETSCAIEQEAIRRGGEQARHADLVLIVMDGSLPCSEQVKQGSAMQALISPNQHSLVVHNKADVSTSVASKSTVDAIWISALTGAGIDALETRLVSMLGLDTLQNDLPTGIQ
jgi:tRNA modification GTPase